MAGKQPSQGRTIFAPSPSADKRSKHQFITKLQRKQNLKYFSNENMICVKQYIFKQFMSAVLTSEQLLRSMNLNFSKGESPVNPRELEEKLNHAIRNERLATNEVLVLINEALGTKAYLELGYPSLFEWLTVKFGYSNAAAQRRIDAAKMLRSVPEVAEKLNSGVVNLSTVTKIQQIIRIHEKSGVTVSKFEKVRLLEKIEHKTERETEQLMVSLFPEAASQVHRDQVRVIDDKTSRLSVNLSNEVVADLRRAKELLSHTLPEGSDGDVLAYVLKFFLEKRDPLKKPEKRVTSEPEVRKRKPIPAAIRRIVLKRSNGACTFIDPITKKVCGSRHQIEIDHILPRALGGGNRLENLRALCREHNLRAAENVLGKNFIDRCVRRDW